MKGKIAIDGSTCVVTGAGSGIGRATALALAKRGGSVLAVDINNENAESTSKSCSDLGVKSMSYVCDVRNPNDVKALFEEIFETFGTPGILVNSAGVGMTGDFLSTSTDDWEWIKSLNLDGLMNSCKIFGEAMVEAKRGHIVNLASALGFTPRATEPLYVTTKAAVLAFSQCLRADLGRKGIGVTAICPGVINTPILDATRFTGERSDQKSQVKAHKLFEKGHDPSKVAAGIISAIENDRAVVNVGWEAWVGWIIHRIAPLSIQQFIARQEPM